MQTKHIRRVAAAFAALLILSNASPQAAGASPANPDNGSATITAPLHIDHYDATVAAAHGFEIRSNADGYQYPVPVTPEAEAIAANYPLVNGDSGGVSTQGYDEKQGECGLSYLQLTRSLSLKSVDINTGFAVTAPVHYRSWSVQLMGIAGVNHQSFSGGQSPGVWGDSRSVAYSSGGIGYVTAGSHVMLVTGAICYAYRPQTTF